VGEVRISKIVYEFSTVNHTWFLHCTSTRVDPIPGQRFRSVCCSLLQCAVVTSSPNIHSMSYPVAVCCSVLQCVAVCCSNIFAKHPLYVQGRLSTLEQDSPPVTCIYTYQYMTSAQPCQSFCINKTPSPGLIVRVILANEESFPVTTRNLKSSRILPVVGRGAGEDL